MFQIFKVSGRSLWPEYKEGDFVVIVKIPLFLRSLEPGDVVVFNHPLFGVMIKRVESYDPIQDIVNVMGTQPDSIDSRRFGPIPKGSITGKVFLHIRNPRAR
jgi:signal peptidase I